MEDDQGVKIMLHPETQVLNVSDFDAQGYTCILSPEKLYCQEELTRWLDKNVVGDCIMHACWLAFENAEEATMFTLRFK